MVERPESDVFFQFSTLLKESREGTCIDMCVAYRDCTYMLLSVWTYAKNENKLNQKLRYHTHYALSY